jgi:hypothetical protein
MDTHCVGSSHSRTPAWPSAFFPKSLSRLPFQECHESTMCRRATHSRVPRTDPKDRHSRVDHASDLGLCRSRLWESNPRPTHYEGPASPPHGVHLHRCDARRHRSNSSTTANAGRHATGHATRSPRGTSLTVTFASAVPEPAARYGDLSNFVPAGSSQRRNVASPKRRRHRRGSPRR